MKNYTQKEVIDLLDEFHEYVLISSNSTIRKDLEQFKRDKGMNTPVSGWYKDDATPKWTMYYDFEALLDYGFDSRGHWYTTQFKNLNDMIKSCGNNNRPASHKEVETALKAEAVRRGFKEGVMFIHNTEQYKGLIGKKYNYGVLSYHNDELKCNGYTIMNNGKWATIVNTELYNLEQKYKELGEEIKRLKK